MRRLGAAFWLGACATLLVGATGCTGGFSYECTPAPTISFAGTPRDSATAGFTYAQELRASSPGLLGIMHGIEPVSMPAGASVDWWGVRWTPGPELAGSTQRFVVRTERSALCGDSATLSWSLKVLPAIVITRFEAIPPVVSTRGTSVEVVAEFSGGQGVLSAPFPAPLVSGQTVAAGTLSAATTFTMTVTSPAGDALERSLTVNAQAPPAISSPSWWPPAITEGDTLTLSWQLQGTVTHLVLDPGGQELQPMATWLDVVPSGPTAYRLTARNDIGDEATASFAPSVVPAPVIQSFTATPSSPALGGTADLVAVFAGGAGLLRPCGTVDGPTVSSGVPVTVGPLQGNSLYRLQVTNAAGRSVLQDLVIGLSGPGTWEILDGSVAGSGRSGHTATSLGDGRVLVAGGTLPPGSPEPFPARTEIYDPATGTTAPGPTLLHPRQGHAAALLADGRVLLAGGSGPSGAAVDEAELLDPASGSTAAGTVGPNDWLPELVALPDGSALLLRDSMYHSADVYRFDPKVGALAPFTQAAGLGWARPFLLGDGRVLLLTGGRYGLTPSLFVDPSTGATAVAGTVLRNMGTFEAALLSDGRLLMTDGAGPAEVYEPATGLFSESGTPVVAGLSGHLALLPGGAVLGAGPRSMLWDPGTGAFRETGGMLGSGGRPLVLLPGGTVLATGGTAERYRPP